MWMLEQCKHLYIFYHLSDGRTPIYLAVVEGLNEIIQLLLEAGADVNVKTK